MKKGSYFSPYANLAAAIIQSGEQHNDELFLHSDWCDTLKLICKLDQELHSGVRAQFNVGASKAHINKE